MRRLLFVSALLLAVLPARARDNAAPPGLTPKEIADGWLQLYDGETTFGWKIDGDAKVVDGALVLGGAQPVRATPTNRFAAFELRLESQGAGQLVLETDKGTSSLGLSRQNSVLSLKVEVVPGQLQSIGSTTAQVGNDGAHIDHATVQHDGSRPLTLRFEAPAGGKLVLRSLRLRPTGLQPLFNGKDLTGWKEFPGRKSKFSVEDGTLTIKNGPGDLQTEGQWANFVLQVECRSNGEHLNSGVFFRCRPNEYQQGYEAQIHNAFTAEPAKEYTLEEYDPETHKLIGKKKVKFAAVDYGTGAIYRRQPARKQASRDHEWFTMTVVADGRHLSVWVNGVQVTDWTDNRPPKDNARNGCRLEAGPISLQGHDPTTDLSFRNIRIAELPAAKSK